MLSRKIAPYFITLAIAAGLPAKSLGLFGECPTFLSSLMFTFPHNSIPPPLTPSTKQCIAFKTEQGMTSHLSKKAFCQKAMGVAVPLMHPPTITIPLDPPTLPTKHKNKKRPAPPQLSHGLKPPPISQSKMQAPSKLLAAPAAKEII
jgi:hypothetical protein